MRKIRVRRRIHQFVLDGLFIALIAHFMITGSLVPNAIVGLFRDQPQIAVVTEPVIAPDQAPRVAPAIEDSDLLPET
jgi:hypothetical protein